MKAKLVWQESGARTFVLVLDQGDEAIAALADFVKTSGVSAASLTGLGAFESATLGWFDFQTKRYQPIAVEEQCEVVSFVGDVAFGDDGNASLHVHALLGLRNGTTRGGHLLTARVRPTLEVTLTQVPAHLRRKKRSDLGIALIDLGD